MHKTIDLSAFRAEFVAYGRADQFTPDGLRVLFEHLEALEADCGPIELDVVALCCEYSEEPVGELAREYDIHSDDLEAAVLDYLSGETAVCGVTDAGTVVYAAF